MAPHARTDLASRTLADIATTLPGATALLGTEKMATIVFKCPRTGMNAQGWLPEAEYAEDFTYTLVACPACKGSHLVNSTTGETLVQKAARQDGG